MEQSHVQSPDEKWQQEQGLPQQQHQQQHSVHAHYGNQPANYYPQPPEEMPTGQARTPELAGEGAERGQK